MPIRIEEFNVTVPDGCVIGVIGEAQVPFTESGTIELLARRQSGETLFIRDLDPRIVDEIWWIRDGQLRRGDPDEVLREYQRFEAQRLRAEAAGRQIVLPPALRRGDGRAKLVSIETLDADGHQTSAWTSGEEALVRITVEFTSGVEDPVVGIMIRTRVGFEVYGTNTELEQLKLGPVLAGERRIVTFAFASNLCPQEYTITAASHDPDGVWHDWMEDAMAFRILDSRYTAGVANLRARASALSQPPQERGL